MKGATLDRKIRSSEVLNFSITEILLVVIFAVLTFTHYNELENREIIGSKDAEIQALWKQTESIREELRTLELRYNDLRRSHKMALAELEQWKALIRNQLIPQGTLTPEAFKAALEEMGLGYRTAKRDLEHLRNLVESLQQAIESKDAKIMELSSLVDDLRGQLERFRVLNEKWASRPGGAGLDNPRCRVPGAPSEPSKVYDLVMGTDYFELTARWSADLDQKYYSIPAFFTIGRARRLTHADFVNFGKRIYRWSVTDRGCRFIVRVIDNTGESKSTYRRQLSTIERFFYISFRD